MLVNGCPPHGCPILCRSCWWLSANPLLGIFCQHERAKMILLYVVVSWWFGLKGVTLCQWLKWHYIVSRIEEPLSSVDINPTFALRGIVQKILPIYVLHSLFTFQSSTYRTEPSNAFARITLTTHAGTNFSCREPVSRAHTVLSWSVLRSCWPDKVGLFQLTKIQ